MIRTLKSGEERVVPSEVPPIGIPRWFPDGRTVLIASRVPQGPGLTLYRMDVASGKAQPLDHTSGSLPVFSLSSDGNSAYYTDGDRIIRFDIPARQETELNKADYSAFYSLAVSPDGKQLAYLFWSKESKSSIRIMPATGGESREVFTSSPWSDVSRFNAVSWTADQKYLLVTAPRPDNRENALWRVPVAGGPAEQMGLSMPRLNAVQVHPDGKRLFFVSNDSGPTEVWALENFLPNTKGK